MYSGTFDRQDSFSSGDVVTLKTGGARMTVTYVGYADDGGDWLLCQWFDAQGELRQEKFPHDALSREPRSISPGRVHIRGYEGEARSQA